MDMSIVIVRTVLDAPAHAIWRAVRTPAGFRFVTRGLVDLAGIDEHEDTTWEPGTTMAGRLRVLGIPFSKHRITLESIDHERRRLQSDEGGGPIRSWRHLITVEQVDGEPGRSHYTDTIEIRAGALTPAIVGFAHVFYRLRQRRWRRLAPVLAAVSTDATTWLARHEAAFNTGDWDDVLGDYTDDAVLEAHVGGQRMDFTGVAAIHEALQVASASGAQTHVARAVADDRTVAALITDESDAPFMVSFWHLRDGRISRDVSIVLGDPSTAPSA
jgi:ketosteroid isomerase-like protein